MINTIFELRFVLDYIGKNTTNKEYTRIKLNDYDLFIIERLRLIFEVFSKPIIKLQGQIYTTIPKALLYIANIYRKLEDLGKRFDKEKTKFEVISPEVSNSILSSYLYIYLLTYSLVYYFSRLRPSY
jgi:hypothetical protein